MCVFVGAACVMAVIFDKMADTNKEISFFDLNNICKEVQPQVSEVGGFFDLTRDSYDEAFCLFKDVFSEGRHDDGKGFLSCKQEALKTRMDYITDSVPDPVLKRFQDAVGRQFALVRETKRTA